MTESDTLPLPAHLEALEEAIQIANGVGALAASIGVVQGAVSNWKKRGRVPAEHCPAIERATDRRVTCEKLRPDVDWAYVRAQVDAQPEQVA